jgi:negative regulator of sigma E activity
MKRNTHVSVMRYLDDELSAEEQRALEAELAVDPDAQSLLANLEYVGSVVREVADRSADVDLTDSIMARVDADAAVPPPQAPPVEAARDRVRALEDARDAKATRARAPIKAAALVAVSLAIAAGAALFIGAQQAPDEGGERARAAPAPVPLPQASAETERVALGESRADAADADTTAAAIESVDFGSSAGSIFLVAEGEGEETTPVVWLVDEPPPDPSRMEPL